MSELRKFAAAALVVVFAVACGEDVKVQNDAIGDQDSAVAADSGIDVVGDSVGVDTAGGDSVADTSNGDAGTDGISDTLDADDGGNTADSKAPVEKCNGIDDDGNGKTDEGACDDGLACTIDECDKFQKFCTFSAIKDGGACDDGNACTAGDACNSGLCFGTDAADCNDGDGCTNDTCDPKVGACAHTPRSAGATCDDGDACTEGDICKSGACTGNAVVCDDNNPCSVDSCDLAVGCTAVSDEGAGCDDGDPCSKADACINSVCAGVLPKDCKPDGPCQLAACDPTDGSCKKVNKPEGAGCDDGDNCTSGDTCSKGACVASSVVQCPKAIGCVSSACDAGTGKCANTILNEGASCDDGNSCTLGETCTSGVCSFQGPVCEDNNPCTKDACDGAAGCTNVATVDGACDDGDACSVGEACAGGKCAGGQKKTCDDGTLCTDDACDAATGACVNDAAKADGKPCDDDGSACTTGEKCTQGKCLGGAAKNCTDALPCTSDGCDPKTGACVFPPAKVGTACNDGSFCSFGDACDEQGKCSGTQLDCDDKNACTTDSCDPKSGQCSFIKKATGDGCEDGDLCTSNDTCDASGTCKSGKSLNCDDANLCTDDVCDAGTGKCANMANKKPCDDGSICTTGESCIAGVCKSGIDGDVSTAAGTGTAGFLDGQAASAKFFTPRDVAVGSDGVALVADGSNHRIRKIASDGTVTTLAGSASTGLVDGDAQTARFNYPVAIAIFKGTGDAVVADRNNHAIRRVTVNGIVTTVAGAAQNGYVDGKGSLARFYYPEGIDVDANGQIYVADRSNHCIRRIDIDGTVTTLAGKNIAGFADSTSDLARFNSPTGVAVDGNGTVFVTDQGNYRVRAILPDGSVSTVAGSASAGYVDGFGADALFNALEDISLSPGGYLIVVDRGNVRLRKVTKQGEVSTFSGSGVTGYLDGVAQTARFSSPYGVGVDSEGRAWIADSSNQRIRRTALGTTICNDDKICTLDSCDASKGCVHAAIAVGKACEDDGTCLTGGTCDGAGACKGQVAKCKDAAPCVLAECDAVSGTCKPDTAGKKCDDGDPCTTGEACAIGACVATQHTVSTLTGNGSNAVIDGSGANAQHSYPRGMTYSKFGALYVADYSGHRIRRITGNNVVTIAGEALGGYQDGAIARFNGPTDVGVAPNGDVWVADRNNHRIRIIGTDGQTTTAAGSGTATWVDGQGAAASFYYPEGIAIASDGDAYVADTYNNRIRRVTPAGAVTTIVGSGSSSYLEGTGTAASLYRPGGLSIGPGNMLYFADTYTQRIRKVDLKTNVTSLLAGSGTASFANGWGASASFYYPSALAVDADGVVYVADRNNHRIRRITPGGEVTTLAGSAAGYQDGPAETSKLNTPFGVAVHGTVVAFSDTGNYRIRQIVGPEKDCDDGNPCSADACDPKTGACKHVVDPQCCNPNPVYLAYGDAADVDGYSFFTCNAEKLTVEGSDCTTTTGKPPTQGWQYASTLDKAWTSPGALYYGELSSETYDFGASAGKMITAPVSIPSAGTTLSFRVYFDTEPQSVFDRLYVWLQVDGKRINVGSNDPPNYGAAWYKGAPGFDVSKSWYKVDIDIKAYAGKKVALEFSFNTGDGLKNNGLGVVIDDLLVTQSCAK